MTKTTKPRKTSGKTQLLRKPKIAAIVRHLRSVLYQKRRALANDRRRSTQETVGSTEKAATRSKRGGKWHNARRRHGNQRNTKPFGSAAAAWNTATQTGLA